MNIYAIDSSPMKRIKLLTLIEWVQVHKNREYISVRKLVESYSLERKYIYSTHAYTIICSIGQIKPIALKRNKCLKTDKHSKRVRARLVFTSIDFNRLQSNCIPTNMKRFHLILATQHMRTFYVFHTLLKCMYFFSLSFIKCLDTYFIISFCGTANATVAWLTMSDEELCAVARPFVFVPFVCELWQYEWND